MAKRIIGNEGAATIATHNIVINAWTMNISRVVNDVTAFTDTASTFRGGIPTYTGSVAGYLQYDAADTSPKLAATDFASSVEPAVVLTAATGCTYTGDVAVSGVSLGTSKTGDTTVSFDFSFIGAPTEAWDVTP